MKIKPSIAISENGFLFDPGSGESYTTNTVAKEIIFMMKQQIPSGRDQGIHRGKI